MAEFIIRAMDFTDKEAINRRMSARPFHLERMKAEKQKGVFILGGAVLSDDGEMMGSVIILSLPDINSVHNWIAHDPYIKSNVWNEVSVIPFRIADV